jgi:glycosyltransferase involved in cell wall biosynthesis
LYILHIWDQAGVAYTIAKFQRKNGDESQVIRVKGPDKYRIDEFYRNYGIFVTPDELVSKSVSEAKKADIIHIHSLPEMAIKIRKIYGKSKLIILHYHGTDIRGFCKDKVKDSYLRNIITPKKILRKILCKRMHIKAQRSADRVIVGTPDLIHLVKGSVLSHITVDTDHFNQKPNVPTTNERAVFINSEVTDVELATEYYRQKGLDLNLQIFDRTKNPISYNDFPNFLKNYDIYVDLRFVNNKLLQNLSTTALQALACGLRVLNYNLDYIDKLPVEHCPMNVTTKLSYIYSQKRNKLEVVKLVLQQLPLDLLYGLYSLLKKMSSMKV